MNKDQLAPKRYGVQGNKPAKVTLSLPDRITNASPVKKGTYSQSEAWSNSAQRPGCQDFLNAKSHGIRC